MNENLGRMFDCTAMFANYFSREKDRVAVSFKDFLIKVMYRVTHKECNFKRRPLLSNLVLAITDIAQFTD